MTRVISQAGDSTDGEDYEEEIECNFVEEKLNQRYNKTTCTISLKSAKNPQGSFNLSTSCILRTIGNQILQTNKIRNEYKRIKAGFVPEHLKEECYELDKILGRQWGSIVSKNINHNQKFAWEGGNWRRDIYERCNAGIENFFNDSSIFKDSSSVPQPVKEEYMAIKKLFKAENDHTESIEQLLNQIQKLHRKIEKETEKQRINTELLSFVTDNYEIQQDACYSLARLKASLKLDRDLQKNHSYDSKMLRWKAMGQNNFKTQKNEKLTVKCDGSSTYYKESLRAYSSEACKILKFETDGKIDKSKLKDFIKSALRGKKDKSILKNENDEETINELIEIIELIFGIEVKRNVAALLTGPMFFDLESAGIYNTIDLDNKMPVAMSGAVMASYYIDAHIKRSTDLNGIVDFRLEKVLELAKREMNIVQDWLKLKLKTTEEYMDEVSAEIFNDLILDWYGIELEHLKKGTIKLEPLHESLEIVQEANGNTEIVDAPARGETETEITVNEVGSVPSISEINAPLVQHDVKSYNNKPKERNCMMESPKKDTVDKLAQAQETPSKILSQEIFGMHLAEETDKQYKENLEKLAEDDDKKLPEGNQARKRPAKDDLAIDLAAEDSPKKIAVDNCAINSIKKILAIDAEEALIKDHCNNLKCNNNNLQRENV